MSERFIVEIHDDESVTVFWPSDEEDYNEAAILRRNGMAEFELKSALRSIRKGAR